ncbi:MAG: hypothetical protein ACI4V7_03095 [Succinivibrionaceae bacterium]
MITTISLHLMAKVFILFCMIMCVIFFIFIFNVIDRIFEYKEEKLEIEKHRIRLETELSSDLDSILDQIINNCFNEYKVMELIIKPDWYIKENEEIKINKDIAELVAQRLSPTIMDKLNIVYNENAISDIIAKKIHFIVANYVIEHNRTSGI